MAERCSATSKQTGERCKQYAAKGGTVCRFHGGKAPQVQKAAKTRAAKAEAEKTAQRMLEAAGVDQDPIEHLLDSLHRAAQLEKVWGVMVAAIDEKAQEESEANGFLRGELGYDEIESEKGFTDVVVSAKDRLMAVNAKGESQVHPYMEKLEQAIERRAKLAKLCVDAGVAERQVELYGKQVEIAYDAFEAGLAALGLDDDALQKARKAYADRLRSA